MNRIFGIALGTLLLLSGCGTHCTQKEDPYQDYQKTNFQSKTFNAFQGDYAQFGYNKLQKFTDYADYAQYRFQLDYTEVFFENNDLLVFVVSCCTSDGMFFEEILEKDGKLYPCFSRNTIEKNQPVTSDFILLSHYLELPKSENYQAGEIVYRYR